MVKLQEGLQGEIITATTVEKMDMVCISVPILEDTAMCLIEGHDNKFHLQE